MDGRKYAMTEQLHAVVTQTRDPFLMEVVADVLEAARKDDVYEIIETLELALIAITLKARQLQRGVSPSDN